MVKKAIKKKYIPNSKEKYMCAKHKKFFTEELIKWKKDIIKANNLGNLLNSSDDSMSSADIVDQASSYTDKSVEMKALNRSRKLIAKIDDIIEKTPDHIRLVLFAQNLDKKSKIRSIFETSKRAGIIPCYQDNHRTLAEYIRGKLKDYTGLSQDIINLLINNSGKNFRSFIRFL